MAKRRLHSIKDELIRKSREAMLAAVQIYNNPQITFKSETFITLAIISWTYLMHAYFRGNGIEYRYCSKKGQRRSFDKTKYGAYKYWELEKCLNAKECPLDEGTKNNLRFLIGIRHEIEHQCTDRIDDFLSAKLQACAINFDYYIVSLFGDKFSLSRDLSLAIQFSPISPEQTDELKGNTHIIAGVQKFITDFEETLSDDALKNTRYAYRVLFVPVNVNRKGQADKVIEFIKADSPEADKIEKAYTLVKETEKAKYLPGEIVKIMQDQGYKKFKINMHTDLWKSRDAKNPKYSYGTLVSKTWYWYKKWLDEVEKYCKEHKTELLGDE